MGMGIGGRTFRRVCGRVVNGADREQQFQMSLEACMEACAADAQCRAASFDPAQRNGFKNCYLKSEFRSPDVVALQGVDTAVVVDGGEAEADAGAGGSTAPAKMTFFTPSPASSTAVKTTSTPDSSGAIQGGVVTVSVPIPIGAPASSSPLPATPDSTAIADAVTPTPSSNAWIAGPIIGSVAAVTLIVGIFILWGRRRRRRHGNGNGNRVLALGYPRRHGAQKLPDIEEESRSSQSQLPSRAGSALDGNRGGGDAAGASAFKVVGGSGRKLGLGLGLGGTVASVSGGGGAYGKGDQTTASRDSGNSGSEGRDRGSAGSDGAGGLADSQNPLRQNRLTRSLIESIPGIPAGFSGPEAVR
ncbi:hypothetical protein F5B20DRAFT_530786 [Whalleya microplaca]|nr:hypothetical protein F5B20DRAFT_530786 [Whalleya microplaca]